MPQHSEIRELPFSALQMYDLVADIGRYPEFLPWCSGARITSVKQRDNVEIVEADLIISFQVFREKFASRVTLNPEASEIDVEYLEGPFRYLNNHWRFTEHSQGGCKVDFFVDFEFKSVILQALIGVVFHQAMLRIVRAFEERAEVLYGLPSRGS